MTDLETRLREMVWAALRHGHNCGYAHSQKDMCGELCNKNMAAREKVLTPLFKELLLSETRQARIEELELLVKTVGKEDPYHLMRRLTALKEDLE